MEINKKNIKSGAKLTLVIFGIALLVTSFISFGVIFVTWVILGSVYADTITRTIDTFPRMFIFIFSLVILYYSLFTIALNKKIK